MAEESSSRQLAHCANGWKVRLRSDARRGSAPRVTPSSGQSRHAPRSPAVERRWEEFFPWTTTAQFSWCPDLGRQECRLQSFSYRSPVSLSAPSPHARAPRDGRIHQPVGARRSRGRRRGRRRGSFCRRLGHGQLHTRPSRLPGGPQAGRHGSGSGGAALPGGGPETPATPAAALGPSGGDPAAFHRWNHK